jgi:hypothetical protein
MPRSSGGETNRARKRSRRFDSRHSLSNFLYKHLVNVGSGGVFRTSLLLSERLETLKKETTTRL